MKKGAKIGWELIFRTGIVPRTKTPNPDSPVPMDDGATCSEYPIALCTRAATFCDRHVHRAPCHPSIRSSEREGYHGALL